MNGAGAESTRTALHVKLVQGDEDVLAMHIHLRRSSQEGFKRAVRDD